MTNWTKEQLEAIQKDKSNIIVSAGAGSGKTAVLSERVIRKVKEGVHINELLLLTFTNNAAKEMKERIRSKLKKEGLTEELKLIDSAYITTFDSYALSVVKKYHYLLNIPKDIGITDESIIKIQEKIIMDEVFDSMYEKPSEIFTSLI
jgi:ATP-dependent helicase/nuclease subunit A